MENETSLKRLRAELDSLRDPELGFIRAGRPRYDRLFGRDSLIVAWQRLEREPGIALATLRILSSLQGTKRDQTSEEEPGKILHEWAPKKVHGVHWRFPYYGSVDATPLFVCVAAWTVLRLDDAKIADEFWPRVRAACGWINGNINRSSYGFLTYLPANPSGLQHQGWKDSRNLGPTVPTSIVEAQGYAYSALLHAARLADGRDEQLAEEWRKSAATLRDRFNDKFWMEREGTCALAIQADGSQFPSVTSNPGHLLFTGILDETKTPRLVERIMRPDIMTPFGIRTLSASDRSFDPDSYHKGSVWPHDNWIISEGLRALGFGRERRAVIDALRATDAALGRLPELYAVADGKIREIPYSQYPQAWATCALLNALDSSLDPETELRILPPFGPR